MFRGPDYYTNKAHKENYLARSVYKLKEINEKYHLIQPGDRVLDLGSAPGSWLQYASQIVGPSGLVLGLDLQVISVTLPNNIKILQADIFALNYELFKEQWGSFKIVLSDMAPHTSGIKFADQQRSLALVAASFALAETVLEQHGHCLAKVFQSSEVSAFSEAIKKQFHKFQFIKPKSSRKESFELYILGWDKK